LLEGINPMSLVRGISMPPSVRGWCELLGDQRGFTPQHGDGIHEKAIKKEAVRITHHLPRNGRL
jgi:hypothetical protein